MVNVRQPGNVEVRTISVKLTDEGQERDHNEDCVGIEIPSSAGLLRTMGALYLVADGMGGHQAGEVASAQAREVVFREYYQPSSTTGSLSLDESLAARLKRALRKANETVYSTSQSSAQRKGMGTTTVAAVVRGSEIHIANVGDSRAYLFRDGRLQQITKDHSFVQEQIDAGILTKEMARNHPQKNVITRAMGHRPDVDVDTFEGQLQPGDKVLLCSDGLTGPVRDEQIATILRQTSIDEAATCLVQAANANGGPDNISVVLIEARALQPGQPLAAEILPVAVGVASAQVASDAITAPPESPPVEPPPPPSRPPSNQGIPTRLLALGGIAALMLVAIIVGAILLLSDGKENPDETPLPGAPTFTPTVAEAGGAPTSTAAAGDEMAPTSTSAPIPPTSTSQPTPAATDTPTPRPTPRCEYRPPQLTSPADSSSHYSGTRIEFSWTEGQLCKDDERWRVMINGQGRTIECGVADRGVNQISCQVNADPGEYTWHVEGVGPNGIVIPGMMSSPRAINITTAPDQPQPGQTESPTKPPDEPTVEPTKEG